MKLAGFTVTDILSTFEETVLARAICPVAGNVIIKYRNDPQPEVVHNARWQQEFTLLQTLSSHFIIKVTALVPDDYGFIMVMEDFSAVSLSTIIRQGALNFTKRLKIACLLVEALTTVHNSGLIHRNLNPNNILVNPDTLKLKLADFSVTSQLKWQQSPSENELNLASWSYMSPELISQTGIAIDYRSDFYSLGILLYELISGQKPLICTDHHAMLQAHISKVPERLEQLDNKIPQPVSAIIHKLLEKSADRRYQSHQILLADLKNCHQQWQTKGQIDPFPIAGLDIPDQFTLSSEVYGRNIEQTDLLAAYERACAGRSELILIHGPGGIGKSTLVHQLRQQIINKRGFFIHGNCDQFHRNKPYGAIVTAFNRFIDYLLSQGEDSLRYWRGKLQSALGKNTAVIADIFPSLSKLTNNPPLDLAELPPGETQKRFHFTFSHFIQALASGGHPLVIFIDNLQWADLATLQLLAHQSIANQQNSVLLVCAYRDDEIDDRHPLLQTIETIELAKGRLTTMSLNNLARHHVYQLIIDSFGCATTEANLLADECFEKTNGNPLHIKQYLICLHETGKIYFDNKNRRWLSHFNQASEQTLPVIPHNDPNDPLINKRIDSPLEQIITVLGQRLGQLDSPSQKQLAMAAHLGNDFSLQQLSVITENSLNRCAELLLPSLQLEFLRPLDEKYKFSASEHHQGRSRYRFCQDTIRQTAYQLIADQERIGLKLNIARLVLKNTPTHEIGNYLFELLGPYNEGRQLIADPQEKARLLAFNLHAGIKAKHSSALGTAVELLSIAKSLLPPDAWLSHPNQTLVLYKELSEAHYLAGQYRQAENLYQQGINDSHSTLAKLTLYTVQSEQYQRQNKHQQAIRTITDGLSILDHQQPTDAVQVQQQLTGLIDKVEQRLTDIDATELLGMAPMTCAQQQISIQLHYNLLQSQWTVQQTKHYGITVCQMMLLTLEHGQCDLTAVALGHYMAVIAMERQHYDRSYTLGKYAIQLAEHRGNKYYRAIVYKMFCIGNLHWCEPLHNSLSYLRQVINWGQQGINLDVACHCVQWLFISKGIKGSHLPTLELAVHSGLGFIAQVGNKVIQNNVLISALQPVLALQDKTPNPLSFDDETIIVQQRLQKDNHTDATTPALYNYAMLRHAYLMKNKMLQRQLLDQHDSIDHCFPNSALAIDFRFYQALTLLTFTVPGQACYVDNIKRVKVLLEQFKHWASQNPSNYQHKYLIIAAELARICGDTLSATSLFDQAIEASEQAGFIHCEALANELFATCWANENRPRIAKTFIREAHHLYQRWGALAKCQQIERQWSNISFKFNDKELVDFATNKTGTGTSSSAPVGQVDIHTLLEANKVLAREIDLQSLLKKILCIMLENSGAQLGSIIIDEDSHLIVEVSAKFHALEGTINTKVLSATLAEVCAQVPPQLPGALIRYVQQTQEVLALDRPLQDQRFSHNKYLQKCNPHSALLVPILTQGKLLAIVYLENNILQHSFSPLHIDTLQQLASLAAISMINAQLFADLKDKNQKRKEQLKRAKDKADLANQTKSQFLANMSHEIRTPLTTVIGFAEGILFGDIEQKNHPQAIRTIANSGKHLLLLINDILDFSKIDAGQLQVEKLDVNLIELLANLESICIGMSKPKGIDFEIKMALPLPDIISTDPTRVNQILLNLISNAVKFTQTGGVTVEVSICDLQLIFKVIDTGVGIKEEKIASLFFAFEQADKTVQRKYGGTGLGLTISKSLAQMLGGDIIASSEFGRGSTFTLAIEMTTVEHSQMLTSPDVLAEQRKILEQSKNQPASKLEGSILVAEDQPQNLQLITTMLQKMGLEVTGVANGQQAIEAYLVNDFDLILLDIQMPVMDGLEALEMLNSINNDVPVIALTANAMKHEVEEYFRKGFDEHLAKPIERKPFIEKVSHFLGQSGNNVDASLSDDEMTILQEQFSANLPAYLDRLTEHLRSQDWCSLQQDAHALKGAAGTLGFTQLSDLAGQIEHDLKQDCTDPVEQEVTQLVEHATSAFNKTG